MHDLAFLLLFLFFVRQALVPDRGLIEDTIRRIPFLPMIVPKSAIRNHFEMSRKSQELPAPHRHISYHLKA
jgi:hypothetical protein